jgi:3-oxoadipate enol-lactonase
VVVAPQAMKIMFGKTFLTDPTRKIQRAEMRRRLLQNDKINIAKAIDGVFSRQGVYEYLPSIKTPTLIVVGDEDIATIPAKSRRMNTAIRGSQLVVIPHAGHTSTIETPDAVTIAIREFLHNLAL